MAALAVASAHAWTPATRAVRSEHKMSAATHSAQCSRRHAISVIGAAVAFAGSGPAVALAVDLPPDWASSVDKESGNTFFYNTKTGDSQWEVPAAANAQPVVAAAVPEEPAEPVLDAAALATTNKNVNRKSNKDVGSCKSGE